MTMTRDEMIAVTVMNTKWKTGDRVLPARGSVSDAGYLWEMDLVANGWRDLPDHQKAGVVCANGKVRFPGTRGEVEVRPYPDEIVAAYDGPMRLMKRIYNKETGRMGWAPE